MIWPPALKCTQQNEQNDLAFAFQVVSQKAASQPHLTTDQKDRQMDKTMDILGGIPEDGESVDGDYDDDDDDVYDRLFILKKFVETGQQGYLGY